MRSLPFLAASVGAGLSLAQPALATNYLLIIADDLGSEKIQGLGYSGGGDVPMAADTPTLDELRASGLTFTTAWANPNCSPTRASLFTGYHGFRTGVGWAIGQTSSDGELDNNAWTTLPEVFSSAGYATGLFGKWHVGASGSGGTVDWDIETGDPSPMTINEDPHAIGAGFDMTRGDPDGTILAYYNWSNVTADGAGTSLVTEETTYADDLLNDEAISWIGAQTSPWFAVVSYYSPHTEKLDRSGYDADNVPAECYVHACIADNSCGDYDGDGSTTYDYQRLVYQSMVQCMDMRIDELLSSIPTTVLRDTIVVFLGDNGSPPQIVEGAYRSSARSFGKGTTYESGIRVPLILLDGQHWVDYTGGRSFSAGSIRSPGRTVTSAVHTMDVYDTLTEAAGLGVSSTNDAQSLWRCATTATATCASSRTPRNLYTEGFLYVGPMLSTGVAALRNGNNKLVVTYNSTSTCLSTALYDLSTDPLESTDIGTTRFATVSTLRNTLTAMAIPWMSGLTWCR